MHQNASQTPPVSLGEEYEVTITDVGEKGDGIARVKNFILFVAGAKKGESVKIRITKVLPKVGFAEIVGKVSAEKEIAATDLADTIEPNYEDSENFGEELDSDED